MFNIIPILRICVQGRNHFPIADGGPYSVSVMDLAVPEEVFFRLYYPRRRHRSREEKAEYVK